MSGPSRIARRALVKFIAAAAGSPALLAACAAVPGDSRVAEHLAVARRVGPAGTPTDPDLLHPIRPWQLTLDEAERRTLATLCDLIIPADEHSPAASTLGAHEFIDEWVSAPYPAMQQDAVVVRQGVAWLDATARQRFGAAFDALAPEQQATICAQICDPIATPLELHDAALFFDRVRELTAIAFYTTGEGMADLGYVGNIPLEHWPPPPAEVLRLVGLE